MSKTVFFLSLLFILFACDPDPVWIQRNNYIIENKTSAELYLHIKPTGYFAQFPDTYVDSMLQIHPNSINEISYRKDKLDYRQLYGLSTMMVMYNLRDTTSIEGEYTRPELTDSTSINFFSSNFTQVFQEVSKYENLYTNTLVVTDSHLQYLQKDYSMLEKFKDYYSKSR